MEIDKFPSEILIKIVGYLRSFKKLSLVSRRFYDIACAVNKNIFLCLDKHLMENISRLQSIEETKRTISKVTINFNHLTENEIAIVTSIITKFSESIKYLKISGKVSESAFRVILSLVPNADQLILVDVRLSKSHQCNESDHEVLNLRHLNTLKLWQSDDTLQNVLFRLPPGVLGELRLCGEFNLHNLIENGVFERQRNIKNLTIVIPNYVKSDATADFLDNVQLESFAYQGEHIKNIELALSRQKTLKSLSWYWYTPKYPIHQDLLTVASKHLTEIETLSVPMLGAHAFVNIQKLTKLKHLTLEDMQRDTFEIFVRLDNSRITTLKLNRCNPFFSNNGIAALAKSAPNLRQLKYYKRFNWSSVLKSFNFVESLKVHMDEAYDTEYLNQNASFNPKLTQLKINSKISVSYGTCLLKKLITDYPNLKKLSTRSGSFTSSEFRLIVDGFQKLELLKLHDEHELTLDDFYYLRDRKRNLKFVSLGKVNLNLIANHMTDIESIFDVVNVCEGNHLYMFDDGYAMCNEGNEGYVKQVMMCNDGYVMCNKGAVASGLLSATPGILKRSHYS